MNKTVSFVVVQTSNFIEKIKGCKAFIMNELKGKLYYVKYT